MVKKQREERQREETEKERQRKMDTRQNVKVPQLS